MTVTMANIRREMVRLRAFAAERERLGKIPLTVVILPGKDGRGPAADDGLPLPRIVWRTRSAACVFYDPDDAQPSAREISQLVDGAA